MDLQKTIAALCAAEAPSGFEKAAAELAAELMRPLVDEVRVDALGSVTGWKRCGKKNASVVMLDAHLDEVGLIVTGYEGKFLRFGQLGGVDPRMLPAMELSILTKNGPLFGVVDVLPPHVLSEEARNKPVPMEKLFIDAGFETEEEARAAVPKGTPVSYRTPCFAMGEHQLCAKSLDDRSCAAILLSVMDEIKDETLDVDLAVHLAVQEEVGGRGALPGAYAIHPQYGLALDVTFGATPDSPAHETMKMNGGAAIGVGTVCHRSVSDKLEELAKRNSIPYQIEVLPRSTGTDADEMQTSREGVAVGTVSLPLKYMHTPVEVIDLRDALACRDLVCAWLRDLGKEAEE